MRRDQMDGLRALCFFLVFGVHAWPNHVRYGYAGVYVFFALSGYLITGILNQLEFTRSNLADFYARRFLRICPIYYLYFFLIALMGFGIYPWYLVYAPNIQDALDHGWPASDIIGHCWSLGVEFQFYLIFPPLFLATPPRYRIYFLSGLLLISKVTRYFAFELIPFPWGFFLTPVPAEYILWGCVFALVPPSLSERLSLTSIIVGIALFFGWTAAYDITKPGFSSSLSYSILGGSVDGLGAAMIVYGLWWSRGWVTKILCFKPLVYTGSISYGLYLYHAICLRYCGWPMAHIRGVHRLPWWFVALASTFLISMISWHFIEKPINQLKRYLPYKNKVVRE